MAQIPTQLRDKNNVLVQAWTQLANIINNLVVQVFSKPSVGDAPLWDGEKWVPGSPGGPGTVTSVGLAAPPEFTVSGSPVTSAGTITIAKANESANTVWAGPSSGAAAAPTFRAIVTNDLPNTAVTPGAYTNSNITVDSKGRITAAANGSGGFGGYNEVGPSPSSPPALASWTKYDTPNTGTFLDRIGGVFIGSPGAAQLKALYIAAPGVPFTIVGRFQATLVYRNFPEYGIIVGDSAGKLEVMGFVYSGGIQSYSGKWNSDTSFNGDRTVTYLTGRESLPYFKVQYDGTNIIYSASASGLPSDFIQVISYAATSFLSGVNRIGFYVGKGTGGDTTFPANVTCTYWLVTTP